MAVNGIEIEVGQSWRTKDGQVVKVVGYEDQSHPYFFWGSNDSSYTVAGSRFDGQSHGDDFIELIKTPTTIEQPTARLVPTAPDLLDKAAAHMRERAATYDSPGGERSMAKTVELFNLHHDMALTEAQGWHFMQILKDVRLFSAKGYHADSAEDKIAYAALMSEAKAKEGV